jgi:hypothetical protein
MHVSGKLALRVAVIGVALGAIAAPATMAHAGAPRGTTATPTVTVTPDTGLKNGAKVTVSGTNFPANQSMVFVTECSSAANPANCDLSNVDTSGSTDGSGSFSGVTYTVHTGTIGSKSCNAGSTCFIGATTSPVSQDSTNSASAKITFAGSAKAKTTTKAKFAAKSHRITGKVKAAGKGVKGLKTKLEIRKHGHWKMVATLKTHKGGAFASKKIHKSGTYEVKTPKQKSFGASHSKKIKVKA